MAVFAPGDTPDESGAPQRRPLGLRPFGFNPDIPSWGNDGLSDGFGSPEVDIPGQFGLGGFFGSPKITPNASGPAQGLSLGGSAHIDPTTGKPEMLTGPGGIAEKTAGFNPFSLLGAIPNPYWKAAIAGAGVMAPSPAETGEFNPPMVAGRPEAPMGGVHGVPAPAAAPPQPPARPVTPTPATAYPAAPMPARPVTPTPRAAAPKAAPPLSAFTLIDRPNMTPQNSARGRQGAPQMTALDLSRLFGGGR